MGLGEQDIAEKDLQVLLQSIYDSFGYDFRHYAQMSIRRRLARICNIHRMKSVLDIQTHFTKENFIQEFIGELTVGVTEMFRDPEAWRFLRDVVLPSMHTSKGGLKALHCGCSTGEEVYTFRIMLQELGLEGKISQKATDLNPDYLEQAKTACYSFRKMDLYERNYKAYGGKKKLGDYYQLEDFNARLNEDLKTGIAFEQINLTDPHDMGKYDLIFCRNVMIYFDQDLQNDILDFFYRSLKHKGWLVLGQFESLLWCKNFEKFKQPDSFYNLMQKP